MFNRLWLRTVGGVYDCDPVLCPYTGVCFIDYYYYVNTILYYMRIGRRASGRYWIRFVCVCFVVVLTIKRQTDSTWLAWIVSMLLSGSSNQKKKKLFRMIHSRSSGRNEIILRNVSRKWYDLLFLSARVHLKKGANKNCNLERGKEDSYVKNNKWPHESSILSISYFIFYGPTAARLFSDSKGKRPCRRRRRPRRRQSGGERVFWEAGENFFFVSWFVSSRDLFLLFTKICVASLSSPFFHIRLHLSLSLFPFILF